ncbi:MAG: ImmA/IrrE family metallo-endopeptidase [Thermoleophilia bacterium]|nr:ImmA/IrrE family metallo-endopeptidase [Thermoleophilia bacterium]
MEQLGLRQADLAPLLGARSRVSEILGGKRTLTLNMIRALNERLGIPLESLIGGQESRAAVDLAEMHVDSLPVREMAKRGWFPWFQGSAREAADQSSELVAQWLSGIQAGRLKTALTRQHVRAGSQSDDGALLAWKLRILWLAEREELPTYRQGTVDADFARELVRLSAFDEGPRLAREFLRKSGIHLLVERHLPHTHLDGMATVNGNGTPVIGLTLRHDRIDNFWFTLCHELAHISLHFGPEQVEEFVDDLDAAPGEKLEGEADRWAEEVLIPSRIWENAAVRLSPRAPAVLALASEIRIHPAIIAGRIRKEQSNYKILTSIVGNWKVRSFFEETRAA